MKISLEEFCQILSQNYKKVEQISGFYHYMTHVKKITKATSGEFEAYFKAFRVMPC